MTAADYVLAVAALLACLAGAFCATVVAAIGGFVPAPDRGTDRTQRKGCAALLAALACIAYFAGVLIAGNWGWPEGILR